MAGRSSGVLGRSSSDAEEAGDIGKTAPIGFSQRSVESIMLGFRRWPVSGVSTLPIPGLVGFPSASRYFDLLALSVSRCGDRHSFTGNIMVVIRLSAAAPRSARSTTSSSPTAASARWPFHRARGLTTPSLGAAEKLRVALDRGMTYWTGVGARCRRPSSVWWVSPRRPRPEAKWQVICPNKTALGAVFCMPGRRTPSRSVAS